MNIVFLIGNGFDMNLGMKTSYAAFYEHYTRTYRSLSKPVNLLMDNIAQYKNTNLWADLEKGLGEFTAKLTSTEELREAYFHINDALKDYLKDQNLDNKYLTANVAAKLKVDLMNPHQGFRPRLRQEVVNFMNPGSGSNDFVNIITFNYTDTIEKIFTSSNMKLPLELGQKNTNGNKRVLQNIYHIHGTLDDSELIMGVNDKSQIKNEHLAKDPSALSMLMKPETTISRGDLLDDKCEKLMREADMFCLFGLSLGETDNKWWKLLAGRFTSSNAHIIYYAHTNKVVGHSQDLWDMERSYRDMLLEKFAGKSADKDALTSRVHVLVNSKMFKLE